MLYNDFNNWLFIYLCSTRIVRPLGHKQQGHLKMKENLIYNVQRKTVLKHREQKMNFSLTVAPLREEVKFVVCSLQMCHCYV